MTYDKKQIELKLYGLAHEGGGDVRADVFVKKMDMLLKGLRAADQQNNGQKTLDYLITDLKHSSAHASMTEFQYNIERVPNASAVEAFHAVISSVKDGHGIPRGTNPALAKIVAGIGNGTEKVFSHGEIGISGKLETVVRIDTGFDKRADRAYRDYKPSANVVSLFEGTSYSTFKGKLKVIDLRGTVTSAKLILSIGGIELQCTANSVTVQNLKDNLDQEAIITGFAHYNGKDRLPEHVEIKKIEPLGDRPQSLRKWNGAFDLEYPDAEDIW